MDLSDIYHSNEEYFRETKRTQGCPHGNYGKARENVLE